MKKSNFEEVSFFRYWYKQRFNGACYIAVTHYTSLLREQQRLTNNGIYSEEDKVFIKVMHQERVVGDFYERTYEQKLHGLCPSRLWRSMLMKSGQMERWITNPAMVKCTAWISQNIDSIMELVFSQERALDTHKTGVSKTSVHIGEWNET